MNYWAALSLSFRLISILMLFTNIKAWGPQVSRMILVKYLFQILEAVDESNSACVLVRRFRHQ